MKKFFKLFAVALVAGCMFTACGEKENNGENNGGNNGGNEPTPKTVFTFDGTEYAVAEFTIDPTYEQYGLNYAFLQTSGDNYAWGFLPTQVGTTTTSGYESQGLGYGLLYAANDNDVYTDATGELGGEAGAQYANWQKEEVSKINITAIDLNAHTMSAEIAEKLYNLTDYLNGVDNIKDLTATFVNSTWTVVSK